VTVDDAVELRKTCKIRAGQQVRIGDFEVRVRGTAASQDAPNQDQA
jgi:ribosome-associated protein